MLLIKHFSDEDEPLFLSLVTDLFPNQVLEKTSYPELEEAITSQVEAEGLIYHSPWVLKLIQVHYTISTQFHCHKCVINQCFS